MTVWDCHVHVFGDPNRFPLAEARNYTPGEAGLDRLRSHLRAVDAGRVVLVQPTVYGADHACLLDALEDLGEAAVAVGAWDDRAPPPDHPRIRGWRVDLRGEWSEAQADRLRRAAAAAGSRHLELQVPAPSLAGLGRATEGLTVPVVLDHLAGFPVEAAWPVLDGLLRRPGVFVKLSALERAPGGITEALALARHLARHCPDRLLWGSDWPHTPFHPAGDARAMPLPFRSVDVRAGLGVLKDALGPALTVARTVAPARIYARLPESDGA